MECMYIQAYIVKTRDKKDGQEVVGGRYSEGQVGGTWDILLFTLNLS